MTVVCDEPVRPYDRPPLSKEGLLGEIEPAFRPAGWYTDHGVELRLGVAARSLDPGGASSRSPTASGCATTSC